jgi:hypothetical protein
MAATAATATASTATHRHNAPDTEWHSDAPATGESETLARIAEGELEIDDSLDQATIDTAHPASRPIRDDVEDAIEVPITQPVRAASPTPAPAAPTPVAEVTPGVAATTQSASSASTLVTPPRPEPVKVAVPAPSADTDTPAPARRSA